MAAAFRAALGLSLGAAVALGFGRFAYALLLPPMRSSLHWSYTQAGSLNTGNGVGYLLGALLAPLSLRLLGPGRSFLWGLALTVLALLLTPLSAGLGWLLAARVVTGLAGAVCFTAGGLLSVQASVRAPQQLSGAVLTTYYAGGGLGIVLSGLVLPPVLHSSLLRASVPGGDWRGGWLGLGLGGLVALLLAIWARGGQAGPGEAGPGPGPRRGPGLTALTPLLPSLAAYGLFGVGYIAYITFSVAYLRGLGVGGAGVAAFWTVLGVSAMLAPLLWGRRTAQRRGGQTMSLLMVLLALGAGLPVLLGQPWALYASALLFGGTFLSVVASTTALARQSLPPAHWGLGVATYTSVFALFQALGPLLSGALADRAGGLRGGLGLSALLLLLGVGLALAQRRVEPRGP